VTQIVTEEEARAFVSARCSAEDFQRAETFTELLTEGNRTQNLVSRASMGSVWRRHIADSAQLLDHVPRETGSWLDLGTGAGFPGLVLAMLDPHRRYILVESRNLRIQWLNKVVAVLSVSNCTVIGGDATRIDTMSAGVISARAFAPLDRLVALSARFSTAGTHWVLPKGRSAAQEVAALPVDQRSLFHVKQSLTDQEAGIVVGIGKVEIDP
jgi:16S rRNA (guanine527-N7)-methyltransferase